MLPTPSPADSVEPARWIQERYIFGSRGFTGEVGPDFEAYVRVFHPYDEGTEPKTWAEVAACHGKVMHPAAHWDEITADGPWDPARHYDANTTGAVELQGELPPPLLTALCGVLRRHTTTPDDCYFAVWEGWGWGIGTTITFVANGDTAVAALEPDPTAAMDRSAPRFSVPARDFFLYRGQIEQATSIGGGNYHPGDGFLYKQSPTLMWPADHSWCMSTEIDDEYTVIGCTNAAAAEIVATDGIEALVITPDTPYISPLNQ